MREKVLFFDDEWEKKDVKIRPDYEKEFAFINSYKLEEIVIPNIIGFTGICNEEKENIALFVVDIVTVPNDYSPKPGSNPANDFEGWILAEKYLRAEMPNEELGWFYSIPLIFYTRLPLRAEQIQRFERLRKRPAPEAIKRAEERFIPKYPPLLPDAQAPWGFGISAFENSVKELLNLI